MFVFLQVIDNVKIAEVITTSSLQKIKIVYSGNVSSTKILFVIYKDWNF